MKRFALLLCGLCIAGQVQAQNMSIARDQARRAAGTAPAANAPAAPQQPPADPAVTAAMQNIASLQADVTAIRAAADTNAAAEQRTSLLNNLSAAAQGKKASTASLKKLAGDLIEGLAGKKKVAGADQKLAQALRAFSNASHITEAQQDSLLNGVKKILAEAGVTSGHADKIIEDLKALGAETK
jgi:hypothetical protein